MFRSISGYYLLDPSSIPCHTHCSVVSARHCQSPGEAKLPWVENHWFGGRLAFIAKIGLTSVLAAHAVSSADCGMTVNTA